MLGAHYVYQVDVYVYATHSFVGYVIIMATSFNKKTVPTHIIPAYLVVYMIIR